MGEIRDLERRFLTCFLDNTEGDINREMKKSLQNDKNNNEMTWGCGKITSRNSKGICLKVGKTTTFKPKVSKFWSELNLNSILSMPKKDFFFF